MKMNLIVTFGLLAASSAMGADAAFENHLTSTPMVSPAQIYQIEDLRTDFNLGINNSEATSKPEGLSETTSSQSTTDLFAAGIYNIKAIGLRAGLTADYGTGTATSEALDVPSDTVTESKLDVTTMTVSPVVAMPVGPVVIGAAVDVVQNTAKPEDFDELTSTHTRFRPGVLFQNSDLEAGLAYSSPNNKAAEDPAKDLAVEEPAIVTAHGRAALNRDLAIGGIIRNVNHKGLDEDAYKDQQQIKATGEFGVGSVKIEGDVGYNTAFYKSKTEGFSEETIGTYELGAGADYALNKDAAVGGALGYEFGSESASGTKVAKNDLSFAVRGNMSF